MKFKIKRSKNDQFYFILVARNGQTIMTSETYSKKYNCLKSIFRMRIAISKAVVIDNSK